MNDPAAASIVFHNLAHEIAVDVRVPEPLWRSALLYLRLGVAHILTGYDHLSFLLALLLAAGLRSEPRAARRSGGDARQALRSTVAIVSAFTVAHSLTLITQVLHPGLVLHPLGRAGHRLVGRLRRLREPAAAPAIAARWLLVFAFGLVHGLGFASVLREIGLPRRGLVLSLLSFNFGVELGQLLVVGLVLPIVVTCARRAAARFERWASARSASSALAAAGAGHVFQPATR